MPRVQQALGPFGPQWTLGPMGPGPNRDAACGDMVGVRGMPERDVESLGVMGWGLEAARKFFRRRRCRRSRFRPPKVGV